jgi:hypothetical protein
MKEKKGKQGILLLALPTSSTSMRNLAILNRTMVVSAVPPIPADQQ